MKRKDEIHVLIDKLRSSQNLPVCNTLLQKLTHDLKVMYRKDRGLRRGKSPADGGKLVPDRTVYMALAHNDVHLLLCPNNTQG